MNVTRFTSSRLFRFGLPVVVVLLFTLILEPVHDRISTITVALTFLLIVLSSATLFGRNPALLVSFAAMLCFNYFFLPPFRTFRIADSQNLMAWAAFTITAIVSGELSAYARRRATEAEKQKAEIERLYAELREAFEKAAHAEALERSEKLKSSLLDAVTHDLRTPLTSIKASVTTLLESDGGHRTLELDNESRREFLDIINEESDRLNNFIEGMVEMARVEASAGDGGDGFADANDAIMLALERAGNVTADHRVALELKNDLPLAAMDSRTLAEVIYSLIDNAVKYSPGGSEIKIVSGESRGEIVISVADEGPGIPEDMRAKVFDKFQRVEGSGKAGLGLGLSIARGLIESRKGTIGLAPGENGAGATAVVKIPVYTE
jgi:K+-sensing histidine kinase KdpD